MLVFHTGGSMKKLSTIAVFFLVFLFWTTPTHAEPGWASNVLIVGAERDYVKSLPIELRPYRPFHFYGNTVRRLHYRGYALPACYDIHNGMAALMRIDVNNGAIEVGNITKATTVTDLTNSILAFE